MLLSVGGLGGPHTRPLPEALGLRRLAAWKEVSSGQVWQDGAGDDEVQWEASGPVRREACAPGGAWRECCHRPRFWGCHQGQQLRPGAGGCRPQNRPPLAAPMCCRQEPSQHPDWIRVHAVPSPGRSLQEGGRSPGRRQRADPAKRSCPVALASRGGGWLGSGPGEPGRLCESHKSSCQLPMSAVRVAPESLGGPLGRAKGGGHPSGRAGSKPPIICPQPLGKHLARSQGQNWSSPFPARIEGSTTPSSPPCPGTGSLAVVVPPCTAGSPPAAWG